MRSWAARYSYSSRLPSLLCQWFSDTGAARIRHVMWQQMQESRAASKNYWKKKQMVLRNTLRHLTKLARASRVASGGKIRLDQQKENVIPSTLSSVLFHSPISK